MDSRSITRSGNHLLDVGVWKWEARKRMRWGWLPGFWLGRTGRWWCLWQSPENQDPDDCLWSRWIFRIPFQHLHSKNNDQIYCLKTEQQNKLRQVWALPERGFWNPARPLRKTVIFSQTWQWERFLGSLHHLGCHYIAMQAILQPMFKIITKCLFHSWPHFQKKITSFTHLALCRPVATA